MRVGIITYHCAPSYGAVLQTYALQEVVRKLGHQPVIIDYVPEWRKYVRLRDVLNSRSLIAAVAKWNIYKTTQRTRAFVGEKLALSAQRYTSLAKLNAEGPVCDAIVCGSDQIWHPKDFDQTGLLDRAYFLDFGMDTSFRRVAYAPSFGVPAVSDDYAKACLPYINTFSCVGMREKSAANYLSKMLGRPVPWVCDPTLLLGRDTCIDWVEQDGWKSPQLLVFWLTFRRDLHMQSCKLLSALMKGRGLFIGKPLLAFGKGRGENPDVRRWVNSFRHAQFVLTDSFHGVAFAVLFHRPFIVLAWSQGSAARNDRLVSLLERLDLSARLVSEWDKERISHLYQTPIDWESVEQKLTVWRDESMGFLREALQ